MSMWLHSFWYRKTEKEWSSDPRHHVSVTDDITAALEAAWDVRNSDRPNLSPQAHGGIPGVRWGTKPSTDSNFFLCFVLFLVELQGRGRFRRQARKPPASALNIWCGERLEVRSEDVGKHLAECSGCGRGSLDPGWRRPCGTNLLAAPSSGCPRQGPAWRGPRGSGL